jgi:hypothetical protein
VKIRIVTKKAVKKPPPKKPKPAKRAKAAKQGLKTIARPTKALGPIKGKKSPGKAKKRPLPTGKAKPKPSKAMGRVKARKPKPISDPKVMVWQDAATELQKGMPTGGLTWEVWRTKDKDYSVVRVIPTDPTKIGKARFGAGYQRKILDNYYKTLPRALVACERHHCRLHDMEYEELTSNKNELTHYKLVWMPPIKESTDLSNWTTWWTRCGRYRVARCSSKLAEGNNCFYAGTDERVLRNDLSTIMAGLQVVEDYHCKTLNLDPGQLVTNAEAIIKDAKALNIERIVVTELPGKAIMPASTGGGTVSSRTSYGVKTANRDRFGFKEGTRGYKVNLALSTKPMSMKEIMEAAGLHDTCHNHCKAMIEAGNLKRDDEKRYYLIK